MNILGDFISRVNRLYPEEIDNEELNSLLTTIRNQGDEIEMKEKEIVRLKTKIAKIEAESDKLRAKIDGQRKLQRQNKYLHHLSPFPNHGEGLFFYQYDSYW